MVRAIVGANWGDEGKGKITDMLAKESDIIVRFQGGSNAGHTIINNYGKFALHLLPSGVFYNHTTSIIGNGVALNIPFLVNELNDLTSQGVPMPKIPVLGIFALFPIISQVVIWKTKAGEAIATIYAKDETTAAQATKDIQRCVVIGSHPVPPCKLIHAYVTDESVQRF